MRLSAQAALLAALLGFLAFLPAYAADKADNPQPARACQLDTAPDWLTAHSLTRTAGAGCPRLAEDGTPTTDMDHRGCCSWHSGVCGCDGATGHLLCCDGTDSPSCGC